MKSVHFISCFFLCACVGLSPGLVEPVSGGSLSEAEVKPASVELNYGRALAAAPADAVFLAYVDDALKAFTSPALAELLYERPGLSQVAELVSKEFNGSAIAALSGVWINPMTWTTTVAAEVEGSSAAVFDWLGNELAAKWNASGLGDDVGVAQFHDDGQYGYLSIFGPIPISLTIAVQDGMLYGSSLVSNVEAWLAGDSSDRRFVDTQTYRQLTLSMSGQLSSLLFGDLRSVLPMAGYSIDQSIPGMFLALQLDRLEGIAILQSRPTPVDRRSAKSPIDETKTSVQDRGETQATSSEQTPTWRLALLHRFIDAGAWSLIASTPSKPTLARVFSQDTTIWIHGGMESGEEIVNALFAFAGNIDAAIVREYEQERAEFQRDVGFDPQTDFLANLGPEWAVAVQRGDTESALPLLAISVKNSARLRDHLQQLRLAFQLEVTADAYRSESIYHAQRERGPFYYAIAGDTWLIAVEKQEIKKAIDALLDKKGLDQAPKFAGLLPVTSSPVSKLVYFDVPALVKESKSCEDWIALPSSIRQILEKAAPLVLDVIATERMTSFNAHCAGGLAGDCLELINTVLVTVPAQSFRRARYLSMRMVSMANVKAILTACSLYQENHKGLWPKSLGELQATGFLGDPDAAAQLLSNPYEPKDSSAQTVYYLLRPNVDVKNISQPPDEFVVVCEPEAHDGGAVFGFMDGHVEWIDSPRAEELVKALRETR